MEAQIQLGGEVPLSLEAKLLSIQHRPPGDSDLPEQILSGQYLPYLVVTDSQGLPVGIDLRQCGSGRARLLGGTYSPG